MKIPTAKLYITLFEIIRSLIKVFFSIDQKQGVIVDNFNKLLKQYYNQKHCLSFSTARVSLYYF